MSEQPSAHEIGLKINAVAMAQTDDFRRLIEIAGLDPTRDLRFHDWSGISFADQDLRGFDFTGARLVHCDFNNALIEGARFDQAVLDTTDRLRRTDLSKAKDWRKHQTIWRLSARPVTDGHLRPGLVFQDAPIAPKMVPIPPGECVSSTLKLRSYTARLTGGPRYAEETKTHIVSRAIAVSELRITEGEYDESASGVRGIMKELGRLFTPYQSKQTAYVTEQQALAYVNWLRKATGLPYRLLTRSEWEYCCGERVERDTVHLAAREAHSLRPSDPLGLWFYRQRSVRNSRCRGFGLIVGDNYSDLFADDDIDVIISDLKRYDPSVHFYLGQGRAFRVARDLFI